ncbi:MAG: hypothetical protein JWM38_2263, partial [Sphingomonas bacterium]|nr:hypothetical protein [Sphingomonas bacterium]
MRNRLMPVSLLALAACSGGGPQTVSSAAPPKGATSQHSFVNPTEVKTYAAIGGIQRYEYATDERNIRNQYEQRYAGDASSARDSGISVTYDPRDAIFNVKIASSAAGANQNLRFQDPLHRTDFGGNREPQGGTPPIAGKNVQYLEAGGTSGDVVYGGGSSTFPTGNAAGSRDVSTFFYQKPGTRTKYVTFAGYVRNATTVTLVTPQDQATPYLKQNNTLERAAFAYGERTDNHAVPKLGTGSYTGEMVASMVYNPRPDVSSDAPTYFQWITGSTTVDVDFANSSLKTSFAGKVSAPAFDVNTSRSFDLPAGSDFAASGTARIDLINTGGFVGQI